MCRKANCHQFFCLPVLPGYFSWATKKGLNLLCWGPHVGGRGSSVSFDFRVDKRYDLHFMACKTFLVEILTDPTHLFCSDLSSWQSRSSTRSNYRLTPSRITVRCNSTVPFSHAFWFRKKNLWESCVHTFIIKDVSFSIHRLFAHMSTVLVFWKVN